MTNLSVLANKYNYVLYEMSLQQVIFLQQFWILTKNNKTEEDTNCKVNWFLNLDYMNSCAL